MTVLLSEHEPHTGQNTSQCCKRKSQGIPTVNRMYHLETINVGTSLHFPNNKDQLVIIIIIIILTVTHVK